MEEFNEVYAEPKYTLQWLGWSSLYVVCLTAISALCMVVIDGIAGGRLEQCLVSEPTYGLVVDLTGYAFIVIAITMFSLVMVELAWKIPINKLQYALIAAAMCLFYLLSLTMGEHMPFWCAYIIVSVMTIGLIGAFVKGIMQKWGAVWLIAGLLAMEYGIVLSLVYIHSMALLVGSLIMFVLLGMAMYCTLKLKVENEELKFK